MTSLPGYGPPRGPSVNRPSGVTAIITGILAILAAFMSGFEALANFLTLAMAGATERLFGSEIAFAAAQLGIGLGALLGAIALLVGGGCVALGKRVGVRFVVIGGVLVTLASVIPAVVLVRYLGQLTPATAPDPHIGDYAAIEIAILCVAAVAALAAAVFALLPSTRRYCSRAVVTS